MGFPAERIEYEYQKEIYIELEYSLKIRRRTLYYFSNLILPCVLIASMAVLGFYFPPESGEKITLEITILVGFFYEFDWPNSDCDNNKHRQSCYTQVARWGIFKVQLTLNDAGFLEVLFLEKWSLSHQIFFQMKI